MQARDVVPLLKATWEGFFRHKDQWLAAAISYFTAFAIAPLIIVVVEIAGFFLGHHRQALDRIHDYLSSTAGKGSADAIAGIVQATFSQQKTGVIAQIVSWALFVLAAIGLFGALQEALNTVWEAQPPKRGWLEAVRGRAVSFAVVIGVAFLLLASLAASTLITAGTQALAGVFPFLPVLAKIADWIVSFAILTGVFALLFEYLPDCRIEWRDVWHGALATALLFVAGESLLGWYLGRAGISSAYGTFGALVVFLLWVNYSAQIVLLGAEFTRAYARRFGSHAKPATTRGEITAGAPAYRP